MKRGIFALSILIFLVSFVSAQNLMSDFLNNFDQSMVVLSAIFIISFAIIFFALSKSLFKQNIPIAGVISVVIAFLITYGINKTGFDISGFFFDIGIPSNVLMTIIPIIILAGIILLIVKMGKNSLFVFGGLLIVLSFFVYAKTVLIIIAVVLIILGFAIPKKKNDNFVLVKKSK